MAIGSRLISLFSLSSIAVFICSFQAAPVAALSIESFAARGLHHRGHDALAQRKRSAKKSKRCKPRPAAPSAQASSSSATPASSYSPSVTSKHSSSSPSSQATPSPSPSSGHSSGNLSFGKHGLGWANGEQWLDLWKGISIIYTWSPACPSNAENLGITCCPMLWGSNQVDQWQNMIQNTTPKCAMGFNEPEISGQSNMDPASGVALWNQHILPLKAKGVTLISPAPTSDPAGKAWLKKFFELCGGDCGVDIVAVHWYDVSGDALIAYLKDMHDTFGKPLMLTEFACQNFNNGPQCSEADVWAFEALVTSFMNSVDWIISYMPFGAMQNTQGVNVANKLINTNGSPNALGKAYSNI